NALSFLFCIPSASARRQLEEEQREEEVKEKESSSTKSSGRTGWARRKKQHNRKYNGNWGGFEVTLPRSMASPSGFNIPSTKDITASLDSVRKELHNVESTTVLDSGGMKILDDTEQLVEDAQRMVIEKNPDDKLQKLIIESQRASDEIQQQ